MPFNQFSTDNPQSDQNQIDCEQYDPEDDLLGQPDDDHGPEEELPDDQWADLLSPTDLIAELLRERTSDILSGYRASADRLLLACNNSTEEAEKMIRAIFGY